MNVLVIGGGYVGCVSAACLARLGHQVIVMDTDEHKVEQIQAGRSPVLEPGLDELLAEQVRAGRLSASAPTEQTIVDFDIAILCVSTPSLKAGGVDTRPLQRVFAFLGRAASDRRSPLVVVVRSTVAPQRLRQLLSGLPEAAKRKLRVVANPEFLRETTAIADFEHPPFVIVGGTNADAVEQTVALYAGVSAPIHRVDLETALLVKYASNAYHALKITFANEVAAIARSLKADPRRVMTIFAEDRTLNVSPAYLRPGFAFGGSCLPKDVRALVALGLQSGEPLPVMRAVLESNRLRIEVAADAIAASGAARVAFCGLSFKGGTDDVRESPYVLLAELLIGRGLELRIFDPDVDPTRTTGMNRQYLEEHLPGFATLQVQTLEAACADADAIVLCKRVAPKEDLKQRASGVAHVFDLEYVL